MEYTFTFSQQDVQAILNGLGELPLKVGFNTANKIQQEVMAQDKLPQRKEMSANLKAFQDIQAQAAFDASVDARDMPSGATIPPDIYAGS